MRNHDDDKAFGPVGRHERGRAFWVGLGASAVIVGQSLLAPATPPTAAEIASPPAVQQHDGKPAASNVDRVSSAKLRTRPAS